MSVTGRPLNKGYIASVRRGAIDQIMPFQFNPTEVDRARNVEYEFNSPPGSPAPTAFFMSIGGDSFTLQLLFDAVENYDPDKLGTTAQKAFIELLTQPDISLFSDEIGLGAAPPEARIGIGEEDWAVLVLSHRFRDVRFNRDQIPTRTYVDLQLRTMFTTVAAIRTRLEYLSSFVEKVTIFRERA